MTLWIFGDSFSVATYAMTKTPPTFMPWTDQITLQLGFEEHHNYAEWGVSNDFILSQLFKFADNIQPNDYVILQLTECSRQWFFKDKPHFSNFKSIVNADTELSKQEINACNEYMKYLQRDEIDKHRYGITCLAIEQLKTMFNTWHILVLPGFHSYHNVNGTLIDICNNEFAESTKIDQWYAKHDRFDPRPNHMSKNNHKVLADKIIDYFKFGTSLDLTVGFEQKFLK